MNGFSVEPGERNACVMLTWPARPRQNNPAIRPWQHMAGGVLDRHDRDRNIRAQRRRPLARARASPSSSLQTGRRASAESRERPGDCATASSAAWGARIGMVAGRRHRFALANNLFGRHVPAAPRPGRVRDRAHGGPSPESGPGGAFRRLRQGDQQRCLPRASAASAPCRNRPAPPPGCLRDCRHRGRRSGKAPAPLLASVAARSRRRARSGRSLAANDRSSRGSNKPRHLHGQRRAARQDAPVGEKLSAGAQQGQRIGAGMRAEPLVLISDEQFEIARIDAVGARRQAPAPPSVA